MSAAVVWECGGRGRGCECGNGWEASMPVDEDSPSIVSGGGVGGERWLRVSFASPLHRAADTATHARSCGCRDSAEPGAEAALVGRLGIELDGNIVCFTVWRSRGH